ncbi:MAG: crossover junction endodeoxyribonuclease RuvC [bacterium]|nr:crossover junction endodeoxyribonuclease RuvC [bacterium]
MIVLGIDPGTAITGYAFIEERGQTLRALDYGAVITAAGEDPALRLLAIYRELSDKIAAFQPHEAAVEELFFCRNVTTAIAVGQARGVAVLAAANAGLPVAEYTPLQVKQAVVGYGRASKEQVQFMIKSIFGLKEIPKPDDVADAMAIAVCHIHAAPMQRLGRVKQ